MSNVNLTFLEQLVLADNEPEAPKRYSKEYVPTNGADLRLFSDGAVYPSVELVNEFNLEYKGKGEGNAIDLVDSHEWGNYPKDQPRLILLGVTRRDNPKTDLFSLCRYSGSGNPLSSVIDQGSKNTKLLKLVLAIFGTEWEKEGFIDLSIARSHSLKTNDEIYYVPKDITRGERKGEIEAIRREYPNGLYPVIPFSVSEEEQETVSESQDLQTL